MTSPPTATTERLRQLLEAALVPQQLRIDDDSAQHAGHAGAAGGGHYSVYIVADAFTGLAPLARHRRVYDVLGPLPALGVHALAIQARTPEEAGAAATG